MSNPFKVVQNVFGSFGRWVAENQQEVGMYKKYGPMWKEILADQERQQMMEAVKQKEELARIRAQTANEWQDLEKGKIETAEKKGKFLALSEGVAPGESRRESDPHWAGDPDVHGPGFKDVSAEEIYAKNYSKYGETTEFERLEKKRQEKLDFLKAIDEHEKAEADIEQSEASAQASRAAAGASVELANKRKFEQTEAYFEMREKFKGAGTALAGQTETADMRNSAIVAEANRIYLDRLRKADPEKLSFEVRSALFRDEGGMFSTEWVPIPDDELDPFVLDDHRIRFRSMKEIPAEILAQAKKTVQRDKDGVEAAGEIVDQVPRTGTIETPDESEDVDLEEEEFERDLAVEGRIRAKGGQNLTDEEREYLETLAESREIR